MTNILLWLILPVDEGLVMNKKIMFLLVLIFSLGLIVGSIIGKEGELPPALYKFTLQTKLFEQAVGTEKLIKVEKIKTGEALVLNIATSVTSGKVVSARDDVAEIILKKPACANKGSKVAISRRIGGGWRLIGYATIT